MSKLWKKTTDASGQMHIEELDLKSLAISSPTVIYLSGFMTIDKQAGYIGGAICSMEEMLHGQPEVPTLPNIYAWSYTNLAYPFNVAAYNFRPQKAFSKSAELLARSVILPLVSSGQKPLPLAEAQKNLRNITLFGYSAGTVLAQEVFNASMQLMQDVGYKKEDARKALHEVVLISAGNVSRPSREGDRFTTLYLAAGNDLAVRWKNRLWIPLRKIFNKYARALTIKPLSRTSLFITAAVKKKLWHWKKNEKGEKEKKRIDPLLPSWVPIKTNHELYHYTTTDDEHNQFSKIVVNALTHAVNRKDTTDIWQLLEPTSALTPEETAAYRERINGAVVKKTGK